MLLATAERVRDTNQEYFAFTPSAGGVDGATTRWIIYLNANKDDSLNRHTSFREKSRSTPNPQTPSGNHILPPYRWMNIYIYIERAKCDTTSRAAPVACCLENHLLVNCGSGPPPSPPLLPSFLPHSSSLLLRGVFFHSLGFRIYVILLLLCFAISRVLLVCPKAMFLFI